MKEIKVNHNRLIIITELISIVLSMVFRNYLTLSDDFIFRYKYMVIVISFILLAVLKVNINIDRVIKYYFYINLVLVVCYYVINAIMYFL